VSPGDLFVVAGAVAEAPVEDSHETVGECSQGGVVVVAALA
jgi:hypothetical protein